MYWNTKSAVKVNQENVNTATTETRGLHAGGGVDVGAQKQNLVVGHDTQLKPISTKYLNGRAGKDTPAKTFSKDLGSGLSFGLTEKSKAKTKSVFMTTKDEKPVIAMKELSSFPSNDAGRLKIEEDKDIELEYAPPKQGDLELDPLEEFGADLEPCYLGGSTSLNHYSVQDKLELDYDYFAIEGNADVNTYITDPDFAGYYDSEDEVGLLVDSITCSTDLFKGFSLMPMPTPMLTLFK